LVIDNQPRLGDEVILLKLSSFLPDGQLLEWWLEVILSIEHP